jgi:sec-independent protein translocase protein TatC
MAEIDENRMPFLAHLQELRQRLVRCVIAVAVGAVVCLVFSDRLFHFLTQPLLDVLPEGQKTLQFTALPEVFMVYLKVGLLGGIVLTMPVIVDQAWKFVMPALYSHEKKMAVPMLLGVLAFFALGLTFAYLVSPVMFGFFASYQNEYLRVDIKVGDFFDFYVRFLLIFGVAFELPVFVVALATVGVVDAKKLRHYRRHVIVGIFIAAAVLTPTADVVNQLLVAGPMVILYELSILGTSVAEKRRKKRQAAAEAEAAGQ